MTAERILVVEDDLTIGEEICDALRAQGYDVTRSPDGASAMAPTAEPYDLVLLDLGLPDVDGGAVARHLRRTSNQTIIVVLTARTDELEVISALDAGADDYLTKPFRLAELLARLRAHLRRVVPALDTQVVVVDGLEVDLLKRTASLDDIRLGLRPKELELLAALMRRAGRPVRREQLISEVWDEHWFGSTKTLDVHVAALRRKLERAGPGAGRIVTHRGYGYVYESTVSGTGSPL